MLGSELNKNLKMVLCSCQCDNTRWYKVQREYDVFSNRFMYLLKRNFSNLPTVNNFDMIQYIKDRHGNRKGVMVAYNGYVGWSMIHPKDLKECVINWDFAKALAAKRAMSITSYHDYRGLYSENPSLSIPYTIYENFGRFIKRYEKYLNEKNKNIVSEKEVTEEKIFRKCPFCGTEFQSSFSIDKVPGDGVSPCFYSVGCTCGAHGPNYTTREGAVNGWNLTAGK